MRRIEAKFVPRLTTLRLTHHSFNSSFWFLRIRQSFPNLPTHRTSPPMICSYSWTWNCSSRGDILTALKRSRMYRRTCWRRWRDITSSRTSDHGYPAGIAVQTPRGPTSKGMGQIEISVSSKATAEEFRKFWMVILYCYRLLLTERHSACHV